MNKHLALRIYEKETDIFGSLVGDCMLREFELYGMVFNDVCVATIMLSRDDEACENVYGCFPVTRVGKFSSLYTTLRRDSQIARDVCVCVTGFIC
jgi:hypothetical protein